MKAEGQGGGGSRQPWAGAGSGEGGLYPTRATGEEEGVLLYGGEGLAATVSSAFSSSEAVPLHLPRYPQGCQEGRGLDPHRLQ